MGMRIVVITDPEFLPHEAEACAALLEAGAWRLHIRKPGSREEDMAALIETIPQQYYSRISLHDHLPLATLYGLGGVHMNARNTSSVPPHTPSVIPHLMRDPSPSSPFCVSRSCHSLPEVAEHKPHCDYLFLSPIFDSISKQGYASNFSRQELLTAASQGIIDSKVFALGGVTPSNISALEDIGFGGAAVLGYIWEPFKADGSVTKVSQIMLEFKIT